MADLTNKQKAEELIKYAIKNIKNIPEGFEFMPAQRIIGGKKFVDANVENLRAKKPNPRVWLMSYYRLYYLKKSLEALKAEKKNGKAKAKD